MPFYRIKQAEYRPEPESHYVYQGVEETEAKLHQGFFMAVAILEAIAGLTTPEVPISLYLLYQHEQLAYCVESPSDALLDALRRRVPRCEWVLEPKPDQGFAKERHTLHGGASPLVLKDRPESLLDELIRMFPREEFLVHVELRTAAPGVIADGLKELKEHIRRLSRAASMTVGDQENIIGTLAKSVLGGESHSYQERDASAQQLMEALENHLYALSTQQTRFAGVTYRIYTRPGIGPIIADKMDSFARRSGSFSLYRLHREPAEFPYLNYLGASHVAALVALPGGGVPGLQVHEAVEFGVDLNCPAPEAESVTLGHLIRGHETRIPVRLPLADLTKHVFVAGVTGSGKTSTIKSLLMAMHQGQKPFLVLEPAKTEYKYLDQRIPGLRRFTLGMEGPGSFKINPLAFPEGIHVQTHVDHLKSVFVAAFPMYGPMPYILETALFRIYRRAGWDMRSGQNIFAGRLERAELFPTLADLLAAVDASTEAVGYSKDLASDVRGALKVRIGSLLTGAKGSMLNVRAGHSIAELLKQPAVMELEYIGDDQEKVFLMGLLLVAVYEHYVARGLHSGTVEHLLVIEEAHRLLTNTTQSGDVETGDMKGKAVETFNNMLSEIRTYGQGLVIADQIPSKLSPDVLKNTNLKILHRLFAADDRQLVGETIGLEEAQIKELIRLKQGEAVLFHGGVESAMKVRIAVDPAILAERQTDPKRVVRAPFSLADYLIQQESFCQKGYRRLNAFLLFPGARARIEWALRQEIAHLTAAEPTALEFVEVWRQLVEGYVVGTAFRERLTYLEERELVRRVRESGDPLEAIREWVAPAVANTAIHHPMERYAPAFKTLAWLAESRLIGGGASPGGRAGQAHPRASDEVIEGLLRENLVTEVCDPTVLSRPERRELAGAYMLVAFGHQLDRLEVYFQVETLDLR